MGTNRDISPVQESAIGIDKDMLTQPDTIPMVSMERRTDDGRGGNARYQLLQQAPVILIVSTHHTHFCQQALGMLELHLYLRNGHIRQLGATHFFHFIHIVSSFDSYRDSAPNKNTEINAVYQKSGKPFGFPLLQSFIEQTIYLYSCQLLIWISSSFISQNASIKALARRALVINGMLWSMAPRRIL